MAIERAGEVAVGTPSVNGRLARTAARTGCELPFRQPRSFSSAAAALDGLLFDGMTIAAGGFGLLRPAELLIDRDPRCRHPSIHLCLEQRGLDDFRPRPPDRPIDRFKKYDQFLTSAQRGISCVNICPARSRSNSCRRARWTERMRAGGRRDTGLLHADRRRHRDREGKAPCRIRRTPPAFLEQLRSQRSCPSSRRERADPEGNLLFRRTARNLTPLPRVVAAFAIAEWEEIVKGGRDRRRSAIHLPGIFVQRIVTGVATRNRSERLTLRSRATGRCRGTRDQMAAQAAAQKFPQRDLYVKPWHGIPTLRWQT